MHIADHYMTLDEARAHEVFNWTAESAPVFIQRGDGTLIQVPKRQAIIRSTDGAILSTVGDQYAIHQPQILLDWIDILMNVSGGEAALETFFSIRNGRTLVALLNLQESGFNVDNILASGERDHVQPYAMISTSFDGTTATQGQETNVRAVCYNTFRAALGEANYTIKIRHSGNTEDKTERAAEMLHTWIEHGRETHELARELVGVAMTEEAVKSIIELTVPPVAKDAADATITRQANKVKQLTQGIKAEQLLLADPSKSPLWTLFNGVTRYADHLMNVQPRDRDAVEVRAENALLGGRGVNAKDAARDAILEIARA